jgi:hypothetical protein
MAGCPQLCCEYFNNDTLTSCKAKPQVGYLCLEPTAKLWGTRERFSNMLSLRNKFPYFEIRLQFHFVFDSLITDKRE